MTSQYDKCTISDLKKICSARNIAFKSKDLKSTLMQLLAKQDSSVNSSIDLIKLANNLEVSSDDPHFSEKRGDLNTFSSDIISSKQTYLPSHDLKFVDLFCGIGSFHYSFKKFGWKCVMSCDIDDAVKSTYKQNYNQIPLGDITKITPEDIPEFDILCAGFPCQPFSQCGQHKGFDDDRGTLFFNIMKFVKFHKPKIIILENVEGLLKHDGGNTFRTIKAQVEEAQYAVDYKILKCSDYGIPQMRKRLFMIGIRNDSPLKNKISEILNFSAYEKQVTLSEYLGMNFEKNTAYTIRCGGKKSPIHDKHNWDGYMVDGKEYRLTIKDCLKLQGFDDAFELTGTIGEQWKQVGNTIPIIFTQMIGNNICKFYT